MNYTTALPDFIEMQRVSFCWFIAEGLNEELAKMKNKVASLNAKYKGMISAMNN